MWLIPTAAGANFDDSAVWAGLLLPSLLLHPSRIDVVKENGKHLTQPAYTAPVSSPRAERLLVDGVNVKWVVPPIAGGIVSLGEAAELRPPHFPQGAIAWRAGGATERYPAPSKYGTTDKRKEQRKIQHKNRSRADGPMLEAVAKVLNDAWGPRELKGWCEPFSLRLCARRE